MMSDNEHENEQHDGMDDLNPDRRVWRVCVAVVDAEAGFNQIKDDVSPDVLEIVEEQRQLANPVCVRCEQPIVRWFKGCEQGHRSCQSCCKDRAKLEEEVHMRGPIVNCKYRCAVPGCKSQIPEYNRNTKPAWSTAVDTEKNQELKLAKVRLRRLLISYTAQVHKSRHELTEAARKAEQRGMHAASRQAAGGGGRASSSGKPTPLTRHECIARAAQKQGCLVSQVEELRRNKRTSDYPKGVVNALEEGLAEWEEKNPRKKAKVEAGKKAALEKLHEEKVKKLVSENEMLKEKMKAAMTRIEKLRELWKHARSQNQVDGSGASASEAAAAGATASADCDAADKLKELRGQFNVARSTIKTLEDELKHEKQAFLSLMCRVRSSEGELSEAESKIESESMAKEEAQQHVDLLMNLIADKDAELASAETEKKKADQQTDLLRELFANESLKLESERKEHAATKEKLSEQIRELMMAARRIEPLESSSSSAPMGHAVTVSNQDDFDDDKKREKDEEEDEEEKEEEDEKKSSCSSSISIINSDEEEDEEEKEEEDKKKSSSSSSISIINSDEEEDEEEKEEEDRDIDYDDN